MPNRAQKEKLAGVVSISLFQVNPSFNFDDDYDYTRLRHIFFASTQ
jgi:hypothetical protein